MSKAAENEGIKLRAAWFNNASIALALTGVIFPLFSAFTAENFQLLEDWTDGRFHPNLSQGFQLLIAISLLFLAFHFAAVFRDEAIREIAKLQD